MKNYRNIVVSSCLLLAYFLFGFLFLCLGFSSVVATCVTDVLISALGFWYIRICYVPDTKFFIWNARNGSLLLFEFVCIWLICSCFSGMFGFSKSIYTIMDVVLMLLLAPICEELLMRGLLFRSLRNVYSILFAAVVSSFVFACIHGSFVHIFTGFLFGLFQAYLYQWTGRLFICILIHSVYNLLSMYFTISVPFLMTVFCYVCAIVVVLYLGSKQNGDRFTFSCKNC